MPESITKSRFNKPIIVVSGLPRSGTSMAMQMLAAAGLQPLTDRKREADEDNPKGYYEDERVKRLHTASDKSWLVDSQGAIIKVVSFFLDQLPDEHSYRVVFMERNLHEVLASQQKMLERRGESGKAADRDMLDVYQKHLAETKRFLQSQTNFKTLFLNYKDVTQAPLVEARRIRDFLALPLLDLERMAGAVEGKLYRNRRESNDT